MRPGAVRSRYYLPLAGADRGIQDESRSRNLHFRLFRPLAFGLLFFFLFFFWLGEGVGVGGGGDL